MKYWLVTETFHKRKEDLVDICYFRTLTCMFINRLHRNIRIGTHHPLKLMILSFEERRVKLAALLSSREIFIREDCKKHLCLWLIVSTV